MKHKFHWRRLKRQLNDLFDIIYICFAVIIIIICILEVKHYYHIDVIHGVNGPVDDIYFELKDKLFK